MLGIFDPFAGIKEWWGSTNDWLESLLPDISVNSIKDWVRTNIKEPFQKAFSEFMQNPLGGGEGDKGSGKATGSKSIDLGNMFNFNFSSLKSKFETGINTALGGVPNILKSAGTVWQGLSKLDGSKIISGIKSGLNNLPPTIRNPLNNGASIIRRIGGTWGTNALSSATRIYTSIKNGLTGLGTMIQAKLDDVTRRIQNIGSDWYNSAISSVTSLFNGFSTGGLGGGFFGYAGTGRRKAKVGRLRGTGGRIRSRLPMYGSVTSSGFEGALRGILTAQGFRTPSSYQYYANSLKTNQETWDSGKANCYDGARLIVELGNMFGLKGHLVSGTWNGQGHAGAVVGGKLYDMTQFQKRGVFRGTRGVHFGSTSSNMHYGTNNVSKDLTVNIHMQGATVYGMKDWEHKMKQVAENVFVDFHDENKAIGV